MTILDPNPYDFASLDPTQAYNAGDLAVLTGLVTRSITQFVYDPKRGGMVLVPDLATDLGTPNADFTQWTFTIRKGVRFEDGSPVTVDDVAFGIKRSLDRDHFGNGPQYSNDYFLGGRTYRGPYLSGTDYPGVVVDGNTVSIKMARPFPDMPYWAAFPAMGPIRETASSPSRYGRHPFASGPYKVAEFHPGKSVTLVRNRYWDPDTDPGRHAYPDRYIIKVGVSQSEADATVLGNSQQAQTTVAFAFGDLEPAAVSAARRLGRLTLGSQPCTLMYRPDLRDPQLADIEVRRAIGYAFPYRGWVEAHGGIVGQTWLFGTSILPPDFPGRRDYNPLSTPPGSTDTDRARVVLRRAGYSPGEVELSWVYMKDNPVSTARMRLMVDSFEAAGFRTRPFPTTTNQYQTVNTDPDAPINLRDDGWCIDLALASGESWFRPLFHSSTVPPKGNNLGFLAEPVIDNQIDRIPQLPIEQQAAAWAALDRTIMTTYYPAIVTGYKADTILHGSKISGIHDDLNTTWVPTLKDLHIVE